MPGYVASPRRAREPYWHFFRPSTTGQKHRLLSSQSSNHELVFAAHFAPASVPTPADAQFALFG